jgi:hypothetical protein
LIDAYFAQKQRVAFYLVSGDNDRFGIAFETMTLFKRLYSRQPNASELRIVDGDHSWTIWSKSIESAMHYLYRHCARPRPVVVAHAKTAPTAPRVTAPATPPQIAASRRPNPAVTGSFYP